MKNFIKNLQLQNRALLSISEVSGAMLGRLRAGNTTPYVVTCTPDISPLVTEWALTHGFEVTTVSDELLSVSFPE